MYPEIGFSTNVLDNPSDVVGAVTQLSENFTAIEFELGEKAEQAVYDASAQQYQQIVKGIRAVCQAKQISLSVHAPYLDHNLASTDSGERSRAIVRLQRAIEIASDLNSEKVTFHPGYNQGRRPEETLPLLIDSLEKVVPFARSKNIQLCLENMGSDRPDYIVYSAEQQVELCVRTGIRVALDVIHLASVSAPEHFDADLTLIAPFVANVHIADMVLPKHVHLPLGEGNLELAPILATLFRAGYHGAAIVEEFGGPYPTSLFIERAAQYRAQLAMEAAQARYA